MREDYPIPLPRGRVGASPATALGVAVSLVLSCVMGSSPTACGGDLLRGGSNYSSSQNGPPAVGNSAATDQARANAKDALARTTQALQAMQGLQQAARDLAAKSGNSVGRDPSRPGLVLPSVPNGLKPGGLEVAPGVPKNLSNPQPGDNPQLWQGARLPVQNQVGGETVVTIDQLTQQSILTWRTFNIGKGTRLSINQTRGGAQQSEWISFNKVLDPSGNPTQILGQIQAPGQVYIINQNGIIFGGTSQINVHSLAASSLPINDTLIARGLLNQEAGNVRFLFSSTAGDPTFQLAVGATSYTLSSPVAPGTTPSLSYTDATGTKPLVAGTDYTLSKDTSGKTVTTFTPTGLAKVGVSPIKVTYTSASGDVTVLPGAQLTSPTTPAHVGGRITLVGPNVTNEGTISTADGQTILAAGREVGFAAHSSADPSLRGLDVYVGAVDARSGVASNVGEIDAPRADVTIAGKTVNQLGVIDSSTTVSLNGRIDLLADYGAVANAAFDPSKAGIDPFLFKSTGTVNFGSQSSTSILPELTSEETAVGSELALTSTVKVQGQVVHFGANSSLLAPSANVTIAAGAWNYLPPLSTFTNATGQIYLEAGAAINVAGTTDVSVPITQNILDLQLRGTELADSPLQRAGLLRGVDISVDIRNQGTYNGFAWVGTPLGDVSGFVGLIQHNVGELTVGGGTVSLSAGESVIMQPGSKVDVSGGWISYQGGVVTTTRLLSGGQLLDISQATPDRVYDGIYTGTFTDETHAKYGITYIYTSPLALSSSHYEAGYLQGANGGSIAITAPSMALDGQFLGQVTAGPRQRQTPADPSELDLSFQRQDLGVGAIVSPTPPKITFQNTPLTPADPFAVDATGAARPLRSDRKENVALSPDLFSSGGIGKLTIDNVDGDIAVPMDVSINTAPGGAVTFSAANIDIQGKVTAPSGALSFTAYNYSPLIEGDNSSHLPFVPNPDRGTISLGAGAVLSAAGLVVDDSRISTMESPLSPAGGTISLASYNADFKPGSAIDVSGGVSISAGGKISYGNGGSISIAAGQDPGKGRDSVLGGHIVLGSTLEGYSGSKGGSLSLRAQLIQIGGTVASAGTLRFDPSFFSTGGFTSYALTGLGAEGLRSGEFVPGISIAPGTVITPIAENWLALPNEPGSDRTILTPIENPVGLRTPVSLSFNTPGVTRPDGTLLIRGDFVMGADASIVTDPQASVAISGQTAAVLGSIIAPAGSITIAGANSFPLASGQIATKALTTVYLGSSSYLSTAGITLLTPDPFGRRIGTVLDGGTITVSGNLVADRGAVLDVSGTSGILDLPPTVAQGTTGADDLVNGALISPWRSGINAPLWSTTAVATRVDSNGGTITLQGGEELFVDSTLLGNAGGPAGLGGSLVISSNRFYGPNDPAATPADFTLEVTQGGLTRPQVSFAPGKTAIGTQVLGKDGKPLEAMGHFTANTFAVGGFDSLSLLGNVRFAGPISITAQRDLTVATGGVLTADSKVYLTAAHAVLGTPFLPPSTPGQQVAPFFVAGQPFYIPPTYGPGSLTVSADLIEIGNLSLKNIGRASLIADQGDIRGDGTFDIAGDLYLRASQIYPTSAAQFTISAYDYLANGKTLPGSITVVGAGQRDLPLSAGGQLSLYASVIHQGGVLRAPSGTIQIGWEDTASAPQDLLSGKQVPIAEQVVLQPGSITSVSLVDPQTGNGVLIPYGLSTDGTSWIDPTGTDISAGKLANKEIHIAGTKIAIQQGSTIDVSGGGDLYAYRWNKGTGGSTDILEWNYDGVWQPGTPYTETQIVSYKGAYYYARADLTADVASTPPAPGANWKQVQQSFAVIPGYQPNYAPYAPFSGGTDPGYVQAGLKVGDQIYLGASSGLAAGTYTLLPARYALLPGAVLVTPEAGAPVGTFANPDGASFVSGYRFNDSNQQRQVTPIYSRFEVAPGDVVRARAEYDDYFANSFLTTRAQTLGVNVPRLPADAGYLRLQAGNALVLDGNVLAQGLPRYHDAWIDISSTDADILIAGPGTAAGPNQIVLDGLRLSKYGAESILIGGVRDVESGGVKLTVTTDNITVDNAGSPLSAPEIILAANQSVTLDSGARVLQLGTIAGGRADTLYLGDANTPGSGDGVLLRVSSDHAAETVRVAGSVDTNDTVPTLTVKSGATIAGTSLLLDSTAGTTIDPNARLESEYVSLNSGQIILQLDPSVPVPTTGLVLTGPLLRELDSTKSLSLLTYQSLDIYGAGVFDPIGGLTLHAAEIRGFDNGGGLAQIKASSITLDNSAGTAGPGPDPALGGVLSGTLELDAASVRIGAGDLAISQFQAVDLNASGGLLFTGSGGISTLGDFHANTPFVTAARGIKSGITAAGDVTFNTTATGGATSVGGLGATLVITGASVVANSNFTLHSGALTLQATGGAATDGVTIGGRLDTSGTAQTFYDVTRFTDGGAIQLISKSGDIAVGADAVLDVSAAADGGSAGSVAISVPQGSFTLDGKMLGKAGAGGTAGSFSLDVKSLPSLAAVAPTLTAGGFTEAQSFRVRVGDVAIDAASTAHTFQLSTDAGAITVTSTIDASGLTGGSIALVASGDLTLANGAALTVAGEKFSTAGKGGAVTLEAGAEINGAVDYSGGAMLDIASGSTITLSVAEVNSIADPVAQAAAVAAAQALGKFTGTLHLRAPQTTAGDGVNIAAVAGNVVNASSIVVEGFRVFDLQQGGLITKTGGIQALGGVIGAGVNVQGSVKANGSLFTANSAAISGALFSGANAGLASVAVIAPGAEIINRSGDLTLGASNITNSTGDWDLSSYHFDPTTGVAGSVGVPGVLTLRASNNLVFFNALSDGFASSLYNAQLSAMDPALAANAQSWSYRLTAGADFSAADFHRVQSLDSFTAGNGSLLLGKTTTPSGTSTAQIVPKLFQVIRTGSGDIDISTGRDVVLRNLFANIYTAGTRLPDAVATMGGTFALPKTQLGYQAQYSLGGGDVTIQAQGDISRVALLPSNVAGSQNQLPMDWLYRRGAVDANGNFIASPITPNMTSGTFGEIASTSWWIDFSNFFEGVGALGGGNVTMLAGGNVTNVDAVIPTNARMPGTDASGHAIGATTLTELGGGDLTVRAGGNIDAGVYYVERGHGTLHAGGEITTNATRNTSTSNASTAGPANWLPTTLFLGKGSFDVSALGDVVLGPTANPFLLPIGLNNGASYKTYFSTYAADDSINVSSVGGSVTLRVFTTPPEANTVGASVPILEQWMALMKQQATATLARQPWLNLGETDFSTFATASALLPPKLEVTAFSGDVNLVGRMSLFPSPTGTIDVIAGGAVNGLQPSGSGLVNGQAATIWTPAMINLSDADPASIPGVATPLAYQNYVDAQGLVPGGNTLADFFTSFDATFAETGSTNGTLSTKQQLHGTAVLHSADTQPVRIYAQQGNIADFTLFAGKPTRVLAGTDLTDISLYVQNVQPGDVSVVTAGRDIVAYNQNSPLRAAATAPGNYITGSTISNLNGAVTIPDSEAGDLQIGGPGTIEVLAGRNLDLGAGQNRDDGTGTGLVSIGNGRNPALPFEGANIIGAAGIGGSAGLSESGIDFQSFIGDAGAAFDKYKDELVKLHPEFHGLDFKQLNAEQQAGLALDIFFLTLRDSGRAHSDPTASDGNYQAGNAAIDALFGGLKFRGDITTQSRDIRTRSGGNISLLAPGGKITLGSTNIGNPLIPPGIVTEDGGAISMFANGDVDIGISRIFTLRGGDIIIWSSNGNIAAGSSAKTVKSAPPTRVLIDLQSADVKTDLAGLATGGGIGVLATVAGVSVGDVDLIAPKGVVDAGDAGIRATGNLNIAATAVLNADNIQVAGTSSGVPATPTVSAPSISVPTGATNSTAATNNASEEAAKQARAQNTDQEEPPSIITVDVLDLGPDPDGAASSTSPP